MTIETDNVLWDIATERGRQTRKWGVQSHRDGTAAGESPECITRIDAERNEKRLREYCEHAFARGEGTWRMILDEEVAEAYAASDISRLRSELIQVAAVAVSWVEDLDRREVDT